MSNVSIALGGFGSQGWGVAPWGYGNVSLVATGSVGSVTIAGASNVVVTGVNATGQVGSVTVGEGVGVYVTGVSCVASVTSVTVWITINDGQTAVWTPINDSQSSTWNGIIDTQNPNWAEIAA
jgi:hypothetical protein